MKYTNPSGNFAIAADALILIVLATGELLLVSYEYFNSAAGQNLINEGAVAFYNGSVLAGKVVTFTYSYFVLNAIQDIKWWSQSLNKVIDVLGSFFGSKTISKGKSAKIVNGAILNSEFWETRTVSKTVGDSETDAHPNGTYEKAGYHNSKDNSVKNKAPKDGQKALDNSIPLKDTTNRRIGISEGEIVVLDETSEGVYHGHVRSWNQLTEKMKAVLRKAGLVDKKGNIK